MTDDTRRSDDWTGEEWAGETGDRTTDADADATAPTTDEWNKTRVRRRPWRTVRPRRSIPTRCPKARTP